MIVGRVKAVMYSVIHIVFVGMKVKTVLLTMSYVLVA